MERHEFTGRYPLTQRESASPPVAGVIILLSGFMLLVYAVLLIGVLLANTATLTADRNHWEDCARSHSTSAECIN